MTGWPAVTRSHQRAEAEPAGAGRCHVPALKTQDGATGTGRGQESLPQREPVPGRPTLDFRPQTARCLLCVL